MKKILLFGFLLFTSFVFSQENLVLFEKMRASEANSASKLMSVKTNPNTANYDITYHKLEWNINPAIYFISGKVTTTYIALSNMTSLTFDLANTLTVSSVKKGVDNLAFTQTETELQITLPTTQPKGISETVEINYSGTPPSSGFGSFETTTHNGIPIMWTLSEPFGAMEWWPCKQDLNDKINSIDVYITAPSQYTSVSNGVEPEAPVINGPNKTTHFHHNYPIPAYLICAAVTDYAVYNQTGGTIPNQYPIVNYIYPENFTPTVQNQLAQTPLILNLFENLLEIYPFHDEKYGHAQFGWGGGMEHTTVSFMGSFGRQLIAHEMAHQWFGDKITCGTWKDIWLNEGFATYLASMVIEHFDGDVAFTADKTNMINSITSITNGAVYLTDTEATNVNRIFNSRLSYYKGAMVLNMLRLKMGDALFFQGLKNYLADTDLAYKYAVTSNLQTHLEVVYGSSLTAFFNDWVYNQGYPTYSIAVQNNFNGTVALSVNQTQSDASVSFFEMPLPIRVFGASGEQVDFVLNNTFNGEPFVKNVPFVVTSVVFDPKKDLISKNSSITLATENFKLEGITLYPNPTNNKIYLDFPKEISLQKTIIYNALGQKVKETTSPTSWDVGAFSEGVYFIKIYTNEGTKQFQFVKK
ncbi:M1 family aminopeptidase [uncultured Flavobacterium sp.]|jgi:aminopeptidase N|uniref:M1 family aminopeptidase n=1 Tax=uncultured Flavobacterium sp. TaxID=165435 RepID=UPI0030CA27F1